jgi:hypothetical protein
MPVPVDEGEPPCEHYIVIPATIRALERKTKTARAFAARRPRHGIPLVPTFLSENIATF